MVSEMEWQGEYLQDHTFADCVFSGVPGEMEIQQVLHDTEEKLKLNAFCIEQGLKDLQVELSDTWTLEKAPNSTDCLHWFSSHSLSLLKPLCTGHKDLLDFLKALQHFLKTEQGQEDLVLQLLLDISVQCGVSFPSTPSLPGCPLASRSSLHTIREETSLDIQAAWDEIRLQLRRPLLSRLSGQEEGDWHCLALRTQCLQQLLFLYPLHEVLAQYQSTQVKAMQELLHNSMSSSLGETSFDKVVHGFLAVAPSLCSIVEEDLRVLNSMEEAPTILRFLNETHLCSISQELASLLEKLCEPQLKESAMQALKMGRSAGKTKGAVHAMVPQEQPKKGRNLCLTSHQLRCLAQLTKTLLCMEERIKDLATEVSLLNCAGEAPGVGRGILKKTCGETDTASGESSKLSSEQLLPPTEPIVLEFDWRSAFRDLAGPIAHCVKVVLEDVCTKGLQQESSHSSSSCRTVSLCRVPPREESFMTNPEEQPPKSIAKFCADIMEELDTLFPLALACQEDFQQEIRANFVDVCSKVIAAVLIRLEERSKEVPSKAPMQNLHTLLSTSIYIRQRLAQYEANLKDNGHKPLFLMPIQKCQDLTGTLQEQLSSYCVRVCTTSLLQDPESHHWGDPKPFYEGERCSFSIQMWNYFLSALCCDLWAILPPGIAQEVLAQVLSQTLEFLVQRYSHACPTHRRTLQIRADITAILLCTESLIWGLCDTREKLLRPSRELCPWIFSIHCHCNQLLTVLAITTSPLTPLFETFNRGPTDLSSLSESQPPGCRHLQWLSFIKPSLFSEDLPGKSATDEIASHHQLRLMLSQPSCNQRLLLQTLLQNDCLLLRVLLNNLHCSSSEDREGCSDLQRHRVQLTRAMFMVLSSLNDLPKCLSTALEGYFDRNHLWDYVYNFSDASIAEPEVLKCVRAAVTKPIMNAVSHIYSMVHAWQAAENHGTFQNKQMVPECLLNKIPEEWNYTPREMKRKESGKSFTKLVAQAICFIFSNLPSMVASLPLPVRHLFHMAEKRLSQSAHHLNHSGLLLWNLMVVLCQILEDGNTVEGLTGAALDRWSKEKLGLLSECLQSIMGQAKGVPKPVVQKVIQNVEARRPNWMGMQVQKARRLCSEVAFAESSVVQNKGSPPELTEQKIGMMVLDICHKAGGSEYLRQIYHIIQLNEELLRLQLSTLKDSTVEPPARPLNLNHKAMDLLPLSSGFNPLKEFSHIGSNKLDQSAITEWDWDWTKLLPTYLGLSQVTLRALLANRWEMQDAAILEDEENTLVDQLQKAYFYKRQGS
ncbi:uncharacterized protein KIAA0825 homolog isoform X2 [Amia ocellicauda]|uniref:uncharacterized protein KIAA0825 homolog isoform X2 n=1 Tax=Amia ocellicauda TaxID=2972642 RepID=UPI003464D123